MTDQNPVVWFEIYVDNLKRAAAFYEKVLGVKMQAMAAPEQDDVASGDMEMAAFPSSMTGGGASGALVRMKGMDAGGASTIVYFASKDCAVELGRVAGAGGKLFKPKFSIGRYGYCGLAVDPDGNIFGVHSME